MIQEHYSGEAFIIPKVTDASAQRTKMIDKSKTSPGKHILHHHSIKEKCKTPTKCEAYVNGEKIK